MYGVEYYKNRWSLYTIILSGRNTSQTNTAKITEIPRTYICVFPCWKSSKEYNIEIRRRFPDCSRDEINGLDTHSFVPRKQCFAARRYISDISFNNILHYILRYTMNVNLYHAGENRYAKSKRPILCGFKTVPFIYKFIGKERAFIRNF